MYKKSLNGWLKHWDFILIDIVMLAISFYIVRMALGDDLDVYGDHMYANELALLVICDMVVVFASQSFKDVLRRGIFSEITRTIWHVILVYVLNIAVLYLAHSSGIYSRRLLGYSAVLYCAMTIITRFLWKKYLRASGKVSVRSMVIIVSQEDFGKITPEWLADPYFRGINIENIYLCDILAPQIEEHLGIQVIGREEDLVDFIRQKWVDEVLVLSPMNAYLPQSLFSKLGEMGMTIHLTLGQTYLDPYGQQYIEKVGSEYVLTSGVHLVSSRDAVIKRAMDIVGGIVGCIITLILMIILGPVIYLRSPGPIFFSQTRIGKNGKPFRMYKFRSMYPDAEERKAELMADNKADSDLIFKIEDDPRIIKGIGGFIRRTSLDEFPQFWNVLKGQMSLVGTRPPTEDEWEKYGDRHRARMSVKPGITGLWQISGRSEITDFDEIVALDIEYIRDWNIFWDLKILGKTILVVIKGKGAS